jgi:hypothetical protein
VFHGFMPAALAVDVLVLGRVVMLVIGGRTHLATALSSARTSCHRRDLRSIGSATRKAWVPLNGLEASSAEGRATGFRQRRLGHGGGPYVEHCRRRASRQTAAALGLAVLPPVRTRGAVLEAEEHVSGSPSRVPDPEVAAHGAALRPVRVE